MQFPRLQWQWPHFANNTSTYIVPGLLELTNLYQFSWHVLKGCITSGEQWLCFIYKRTDAGGEVSIAPEISLGAHLENLPLVLGLLCDLVRLALVHLVTCN